jgi:hypothetical protein
MSKDPVAVFEELLTQTPGFQNSHYLKASRDFYGRDQTYEAVRVVEQEFARAFRAVVEEVEAVWGPPEFIGHRSESPFAEWHVAEELCFWRKEDRLAMIWWEHQDKELPVLLILAVLKPEHLLE